MRGRILKLGSKYWSFQESLGRILKLGSKYWSFQESRGRILKLVSNYWSFPEPEGKGGEEMNLRTSCLCFVGDIEGYGLRWLG